MGYISNIKKLKFLLRIVIFFYSKIYKINLDDFEVPQNGFKSFNEFFTRKYKQGKRPIQNGIVSPVDGYLLDKGLIFNDQTITVKDRDYYLEDLLGNSYKNVHSYAVLYLAPGNYHRVHAPFDMNISEIKYLPGTLRSVKTKVIYKRDRVYCRNERIVIIGNCEHGKYYLILVGALLVGKVKLSFESGLSTNIRKGIPSGKTYAEELYAKKGEEIGYFEMGSSVVMLMESDILNKLPVEESYVLEYGKNLIL
jgi:phosphatidylserine decarboxylase